MHIFEARAGNGLVRTKYARYAFRVPGFDDDYSDYTQGEMCNVEQEYIKHFEECGHGPGNVYSQRWDHLMYYGDLHSMDSDSVGQCSQDLSYVPQFDHAAPPNDCSWNICRRSGPDGKISYSITKGMHITFHYGIPPPDADPDCSTCPESMHDVSDGLCSPLRLNTIREDAAGHSAREDAFSDDPAGTLWLHA
jgi:hypothetical protein